jgi:uncharacterized protein
MTAEIVGYPQPQADRDNAGFLEAWRQGHLLLQACGDCGRSFFYPRPLCPHCWSDALDWKQVPGRGEVVSFALIHRPNHSSFFEEVPIILAEIRLVEGVTFLARVVSAAPDSMRIAMPVRLVSKPEASRYPLPTFQPQT